VRYEDILADPATALSKILTPYEWVNGQATISNMEVMLEPAHTVAGNRMRFASGKLRLKLDDEWQEAMPRRDRRTVEALTSPLLTRYGYKFGASA
jgi:hypothetical protein